jgi:hypothetical protein
MNLALAGTASLTADKKKMAMMGGLLLVLLVVLVMRFVLPGGDATDSAGAGQHHDRGLLDSQPSYLETIARIARLQSEKSYQAGDSRDPMQPLVKERKATPSEPRQTEEAPVSNELPRMSLHGVIWDSDSPIAIIDGLDLRVGDTIKGARVVEIGYDSVVLTYKSRRHVLTVE